MRSIFERIPVWVMGLLAVCIGLVDCASVWAVAHVDWKRRELVIPTGPDTIGIMTVRWEPAGPYRSWLCCLVLGGLALAGMTVLTLVVCAWRQRKS
jgi:hypothetical protein